MHWYVNFSKLQNSDSMWILSPHVLHHRTVVNKSCQYSSMGSVVLHSARVKCSCTWRAVNGLRCDVICVAGNILLCRRQWLIARLPWLENRATVFERLHKDKSPHSSHCLWLTVTRYVGTFRLSHSLADLQKVCQLYRRVFKGLLLFSRYDFLINGVLNIRVAMVMMPEYTWEVCCQF